MEIYFDKRTIKILRYIRRCGDRGTSWGNLRRKYKESANVFLLESLSKERYIATKTKKANGLILKIGAEIQIKNFVLIALQEETSFLKKVVQLLEMGSSNHNIYISLNRERIVCYFPWNN